MKPWYAEKSTDPWCREKANRHMRRSIRRRLRSQRGLFNVRAVFSQDAWR